MPEKFRKFSEVINQNFHNHVKTHENFSVEQKWFVNIKRRTRCSYYYGYLVKDIIRKDTLQLKDQDKVIKTKQRFYTKEKRVKNIKETLHKFRDMQESMEKHQNDSILLQRRTRNNYYKKVLLSLNTLQCMTCDIMHAV